MQPINNKDIKSLVMIFINGGDSEEKESLVKHIKELVLSTKLPLGVDNDIDGPVVVYSSQGGLASLKFVFRLQELMNNLKNDKEVSEEIELTVKVFEVSDVSDIVIK